MAKTDGGDESANLGGGTAIKAFIDAYNALCKDHGYKIVTTPAWKLRDDGTWSVVLQTGIDRVVNNDTNTATV